jgi:ribosomal protein S18 acetylase RimI-like enzyme
MTDAERSFLVRRCRLRDLSALSDLIKISWHAAHDHILGPGLTSRTGRNAYAKPNLTYLILHSILRPRITTMLVATSAGRIVGHATAQRDEAEIVLYMLYVHPEWERLGIGTALVDGVIAAYRHAKAIRLEVLKDNAAAIAWYASRGFQVYGETPHATGTPNVAALYMDKPIDSN